MKPYYLEKALFSKPFQPIYGRIHEWNTVKTINNAMLSQ
jgi:hypothetical protein